jgi:hypothetical protein
MDVHYFYVVLKIENIKKLIVYVNLLAQNNSISQEL